MIVKTNGAAGLFMALVLPCRRQSDNRKWHSMQYTTSYKYNTEREKNTTILCCVVVVTLVFIFVGLYMVGQFGGLAFWRLQMPILRGSPFRLVWNGRPIGATRKTLRQNQEEINVLDRILGLAFGRPCRIHVSDSQGFGGLWYLDPFGGHDGSFHPICPRFAIPLHDYGPVQKIQIVQQDPGPYHKGKSCIF